MQDIYNRFRQKFREKEKRKGKRKVTICGIIPRNDERDNKAAEFN